MKRFVALFGVMLLVLGLRMYNNGLLNCGYGGTWSYGEYDPVVMEELPLLISGPHRLDLLGDEEIAMDIINNLSGKVLWREQIDDITIIYAYSPRVEEPVTVHGQKVNLMIAISGDRVSAGTPLLYGSY
ncbi:MAG: hypothetical protein J1F36_06775 [Clostridiales bacterium]|nr:hypothetical protein [Clostridiales bacterium]